MKIHELILLTHASSGLSIRDVKITIETFVCIMVNDILEKGHAELPNFGSFKLDNDELHFEPSKLLEKTVKDRDTTAFTKVLIKNAEKMLKIVSE